MWRCLWFTCLLLHFFWLPSFIHAGVVVNTGETAEEICPIAPEKLQAKRFFDKSFPADMKVGYRYSRFGIFWLDIWTWDGKYCLFRWKDERNFEYIDMSKAELAVLAEKKPDEILPPFNYRFPLGLLIYGGIVGIFVFFGVIGSIKNKNRKLLVQTLLTDPKYQKAVEILDTAPEVPEGETPQVTAEQQLVLNMDRALLYLIQEGEAEATAKSNLQKIVDQFKADAAQPTT